jgi:hypothetical protein
MPIPGFDSLESFGLKSASSSDGRVNAPFAIGGSAGSLPSYVWIGAFALAAWYLYRRSK